MGHNFRRGRHEPARLAPKAREPLEGSRGHAPPENFEKQILLMKFSAFSNWFLCIEQVMNEKEILGVLMKQNLNKKTARPIYIFE